MMVNEPLPFDENAGIRLNRLRRAVVAEEPTRRDFENDVKAAERESAAAYGSSRDASAAMDLP
jgi:hypothetical protein